MEENQKPYSEPTINLEPTFERSRTPRIVWILAAALIAVLIVAGLLLRELRNAKAQIEINDTKAVLSTQKAITDGKQAEIVKSGEDFTKSQSDKAARAIEIQKSTEYEKPIIKIANYSAMLDSLSNAEPD